MGLGVSLREGGNILDLGTAVRQVVARAQTVYPVGIEFETVAFQADAVDKKIRDFARNLLQAVGLVALVMLVFLGLRTGLIVASLIPATIVTAFLVMSVCHWPGPDVPGGADHRLRDAGRQRHCDVGIHWCGCDGSAADEAAINSARELRIPLLTSSLTTAAAFLPIFLAESATGEYTAPLFKVVTITLLTSWVMALTLIPVLCVFFLRVDPKQPRKPSLQPFINAIGQRSCLIRHPWLSLAGVVALFVLALQGLGFIPSIFFPPNDRPTLTVELDLPSATPIERTDRVIAQIEQFMLENLMADDNGGEGIVNWAAFIGQGPPRFFLSINPEPPNPAYGILLVNTSTRDVIEDGVIAPLERYIRSSFPDVNATIYPLPMGPPVTSPIAVRLSGRDTETLFAIVDAVKTKLSSVPGGATDQ